MKIRTVVAIVAAILLYGFCAATIKECHMEKIAEEKAMADSVKAEEQRRTLVRDSTLRAEQEARKQRQANMLRSREEAAEGISPEWVRLALVNDHHYTYTHIEKFKSKKPWIGMSTDMLEAMKGKPDEITVEMTADGRFEIWTYNIWGVEPRDPATLGGIMGYADTVVIDWEFYYFSGDVLSAWKYSEQP